MRRRYTLKLRAEQKAATRRRIVETAFRLTKELGPALTTDSMVAKRAGVQRNTYYAHFHDERSLFLACADLALERDPLPDPDTWRLIMRHREKLRLGIGTFYCWYERNAGLVGNVLRDAAYHKMTNEIVKLRFEPQMATFLKILGRTLNARQRAMLQLALSFFTWRTLVCEGGLKWDAAVEVMVHTIAAHDKKLRRDR